MKALVGGGTGPTGPFIVNGLIDRGYEVTIFHRGVHEVPEISPAVEHIHGDPHFRETIDDALVGRTFDLAVVTYGRICFVAEALAGKVGRLIGVGGMPSYRGFVDPRALSPPGLRIPIPEIAPVVDNKTEQPFSYPHGYAGNLAHAVLLAVDKPDVSAGEIYNCGDEKQLSLRQLVEIIADEMNHEWEIVSMPHRIARPSRPYTLQQSPHHRVLDLAKIRAQLGYADIYSVEAGLARTVEWHLEHQPEPGGEIERQLQDSFDYEGEDSLISAYKASMAQLEAIPFEVAVGRPHPYAHPKAPGQTKDHRGR